MVDDWPDMEPLPLLAPVVTSSTGEGGPGSGLAEDGEGSRSSLVLVSVLVCSPLELISTVFPSPLLRRMTGIPPDIRQLIITDSRDVIEDI